MHEGWKNDEVMHKQYTDVEIDKQADKPSVNIENIEVVEVISDSSSSTT